jgi:hypothetical protein
MGRLLDLVLLVTEVERPVADPSPRERNRAEFPTVAAWLDDAREQFGDAVKVVCAAENGHEIGPPEALAAMRADIARARIAEPVERVDCECSTCRRRAKADETPAEVRSFGVDSHGRWKQPPRYKWKDD